MKSYTIHDLKKIAKDKNGECLSEVYVNANTKYKWRCFCGEIWESRFYHVLKGHWCPACGGSKRLTLEYFKAEAMKRGGKLLSKKYINNRSKLKFACQWGHEFELIVSNFKTHKHWCSECNGHLGERICKKIFENFFKVKFKKTKPKWLVNSEGNLLELDGFNAKEKVAFEYQGVQHYRVTGNFVKTKSDLDKRKKDDRRKEYVCRQKGITLFKIKEVNLSKPIEDIIQLIVKQIKRRGYTGANVQFDIAEIFSDIGREEILQCKDRAKEKDGKFLAKVWKGWEAKYTWECSEGHSWEARPRSIMNKGTWCKLCSGKNKNEISEFQDIAKSKGGECLSKRYKSAHELLRFKCNKGHNFKASGSNVKNLNRWCPECAGKKKLTIQEMNKIAKEYGGKCLSKEYINKSTKLLWVCKEGHKFEKTPGKVKHGGQWCPTCSNIRRGRKA